jgi:hypothetical protein
VCLGGRVDERDFQRSVTCPEFRVSGDPSFLASAG